MGERALSAHARRWNLSAAGSRVPRASASETAGVTAEVFAPFLARGAILRRPGVENVLDRFDADRRAVRRFQRLRRNHGAGPVRLRVPGREIALILAAEDVRRVLDGSPEPFATASREKRAALEHFQPHGVLISDGAERAERRRFNEAVLEPHQEVHELGDSFVAKTGEESRTLIDEARRAGWLTWERFGRAWWRVVRRVVLGDRARDDELVTDQLGRLRADANWAFLAPQRRRLREEFLARLRGYLRDPEEGSLAKLVASVPATPRTVPEEQVPHWLFAFDAAGMASFRALALLDSHRQQPEGYPPALLRACVLESLRLWPTTPAVLRETTQPTSWRNGTLPAGAGVLIFAPFFHRDDERLEFADAFDPQLWLDDGAARDWPLIPFSQGPGECPGRNLVLLLTSSLLATLLAELELSLPTEQRIDGGAPLPATLSPFRLRFRVGGR